ncbi:hypothetical protein DRN58_02700 [Thermococci archaeon]|nr:MAG: hypothetical protein DRN58_02700 [Thermococci archaeon]
MDNNSNLLKHGSIIFISIIVARFFGYIFQIYVARVLGPEDYGIFGSLFSLFLILTIPVGTIQTVISRFTSDYKVKSEYGKIKSLMISALKKLSKVGILGFVLMILASFPLAKFLKIPTPIPLFILAISIIFSFIVPVAMGILQGLQNFKWLGLNMSLQTLFRLIFAILLISLRLSINGVILSFSLGYLFSFLLCFVPLRFLFNEKDNNENLEISEIYKYTYPVLVATGILLLMQNIDVILVKHFFSSEEAGFYAAASNIGKIIFFLGSGLAIALFPKVSELHSAGKPSLNLLRESLIYIVPLSVLFIVGCALFNEFITTLFFGLEYLYSATLLPYFATAMSFLGISSIIFRYLIAIKNFKFLIPLLITASLETAAILFFHSTPKEILLILNIFFFCALVIGIASSLKIRD